MLVCECGSPAVEIVDAHETHDERGNVETFRENYQCASCGGRGTYYSKGKQTTGCLTTKATGGWL